MKRRSCTGCGLIEPGPGVWRGMCPECKRVEAARQAAAPATPEAEAPKPPPKRDQTADRLRGFITRMTAKIPGVWKEIDRLRQLRGKAGVPNWEPWCFLPLAGAYAIVGQGKELEPDETPQIGALAALAAWRTTQGIYRYDPAVLDALWDTPVTGDIPEQVLMSLPEWCVYIETPDRHCQGQPMLGFFAYLEHDSNDGRHELRLMADHGDYLNGCIPIHLGSGLGAGVDRALGEARRVAAQRGPEWATAYADSLLQDSVAMLADQIAPMVSVLLYLCSANAEMRDRSERRLRPARPQPVRTKEGERVFPPDSPTTWEVGFRLGATIRGAMADKPARRGDGTHASPRPHLRRAHWHSYWTGQKAKIGTARGPERKLILKWIPPTPVSVSDDSPVIPTIRRVL